MPRLTAVAVVIAAALPPLAAPGAASADDPAELVIDDPELAGAPTAGSGDTGGSPEAREHVVHDPELVEADASSRPSGPVRFEARLVAEQRASLDTRWERGEDIGSLTTTASLEARWAPTDALALSVGARGRHTGWLHRGLESDDTRWSLELEPTDTFVDVAHGSLRARLGWQTLAWGRMDVLPAADVVGRYDLRAVSGLTLDEARLPVLAAVTHFDPAPWLSVSLVWQPFFEPHRFDVLGGDDALLSVVGGPAVEQLRQGLDRLIDPSWQPLAGDAIARAQSPAPDFREPQLALRATLRGRGGEVSLTAAAAVEHLPEIRASEGLVAALAGAGEVAVDQLARELEAGVSPLAMRYPRYLQLAVDGAVTLAPFVLSFDVGWSPARTLYVGRPGAAALPEPARVGLAQAAVRLEWPHDESLFAEVEAFGVTTDRDAPDGGRWLALARGRALHGVLGGGRWVPGGGDWSLSALALVLDAGPSFAASGSVDWRPSEGWSLAAGATLLEGPAGRTLPGGLRDAMTTSPGGLLDGRDQVWVRLRFVH